MKKTAFAITLATLLICTEKMQAQKRLDVNEISTFIRPVNSIFWDGMQFPAYEVPKGSGKHSIYLGNLWLVGRKAGTDTIHGFVDRYQANGGDTKQGPLRTDGTASTDFLTVFEYNRVWKVSQVEVDELQQAYISGDLSSGLYIPPVDIRDWPANGPAGYAAKLAPFYDHNADGIYDIYDGDYPVIKGETMLFWILNDTYGTGHPESNYRPIGAEIHISFYACKNPGAAGDEDIINYTTFLEYEVFNRSVNTYDSVYAGFEADFDLGYPFDDNMGSHVDVDACYGFNGTMFDGDFSPFGYRTEWPVQSFQFLEGEVNAKGRLMSHFMAYWTDQIGEFAHHEQYYNYLKGKYSNGQKLRYGGSGFPGSGGVTNIEADYAFPWDSDPTHIGTNGIDPGYGWSMQTYCDTCSIIMTRDVKGVGSTGPFTLAPGQSKKVVLGLISTFDDSPTIKERVEKNREQAKLLKQWYDAGQLPCVMPVLSVDEFAGDHKLTLFPNPATDRIRITSDALPLHTPFEIYDMNGRVLIAGKSSASGYIDIDVNGLSKGIYYVKLTFRDAYPKTLKFIKG